jgi:hypothetical protein
MTPLTYISGELVLKDDVVRLGVLDGIVTGVVQPDSPDWDDCGGVSIQTRQCGAVRLERINEDLILVSRKV